MSLENAWNNINEQRDDDLSSMLQKFSTPKASSHNPLEKIKRNLLINIAWGAIICIFYVVIIVYFRIWQVQVAIGIVLIFSLWALFTAFIVYKKINTAVSAAPLLVELKRHHQTISQWMTTQQWVALGIYPISAAGGFMLGGVLGSGKTVEVFMSKPIVLIVFGIVLIVLVPACFYLAKWLSKRSFGKHLNDLQKNISDLQEEN